MPYEYSELSVLMRTVRSGSRWYPSSYVVVHTGGNLVVDIDEEIAKNTVWGIQITPLQFTNAEEDDIVYEASRRNVRQAHAARILLSLFDDEDFESPAGRVPTVIAIEDRPVLAMYLLAAERMGWQETADFLDVSRYTISKYMRRLERKLEN